MQHLFCYERSCNIFQVPSTKFQTEQFAPWVLRSKRPMAVQDRADTVLVDTYDQLNHKQRRRWDEDIENVKCSCKLL
jgi:hypothetical protein